MSQACLPPILSSYRVYAGTVEEITWTSEDEVLRKLGYSHYDYDIRREMRALAALGALVARNHPEHGYWEYGPQWRNKDMKTLIAASEAARRLGGGGPDVG